MGLNVHYIFAGVGNLLCLPTFSMIPNELFPYTYLFCNIIMTGKLTL